VAVVGRLVQKEERGKLYTTGETIQKTMENHRTHKIENKHKKNAEQHKSSNYKIKKRSKLLDT